MTNNQLVPFLGADIRTLAQAIVQIGILRLGGQITDAAADYIIRRIREIDGNQLRADIRRGINNAIEYIGQEPDPERVRLALEGAQANEGRMGRIDFNEAARSGNPVEIGMDSGGNFITNGNTRTMEPGGNMDIVPNDGNDGPMELARAQASTVNRGAGETPISWFPKAEIGIRDTHTACLRWYLTSSPTVNLGTAGQFAGLDNIAVNRWEIRMTSIYDVTPSITPANAPAWREHFANFYEKYSVIGCKWQARVVNHGAGVNDSLKLWYMYVGKYRPNPTDQRDLVHLKGIKGPFVVQPRINGQGDRIITGQYKRGDHAREVQEDSETQLWSSIGENPTLIENLLFFVTDDTLIGTDTALRYTIEFTVDYIVQFKDLKQEYQFRIFDQDGAATTTKYSTSVANTVLGPT